RPRRPPFPSTTLFRSSDSGRAEIFGFCAGDPLDVAAQARHLTLQRRPTGEQVVQGLPQVRAGHRLVVSWAAVVQLAAVDELVVRSEEHTSELQSRENL